jgi:hypothetical protein
MKTVVKYAEIRMGDISVSVKGEFTGEDYELFFHHPMTDSLNTHLDSIMVGWSEMDPKDKKEWEKLLEKIKKDDMLVQKIWNEVGVVHYD